MDELETKAREFEVLSSVNLGKILSLLESKDRKLSELDKVHGNMESYITAMSQIKQTEVQQVRRRAD